MKIWLALPALPPGQELRDYAFAAQQAGAEGVTISEHLVVPATVGNYPYSNKPVQIALGTQFPDPIVLIANLAATAGSLRFMTNKLTAPLLHPLALARRAGTLAALTDGRFDLGIGVGWMRQEFDAVGVAFEERGTRMDEIISLLPRLWTGEPVEHAGKHFSFDKVRVPTPPCSVPIYLGGNSDFALRRAARAADGWTSVGLYEFQLKDALERLAAVSCECREPARPRLRIRASLKGHVDPDRLAIHARLGVDALLLQSWQIIGRKSSTCQSPAEVGEKLAALTSLCSRFSE